MILYIIRHAWAGNYGDPDWPDDGQRPLTDEGRVRFTEVVRELAGRGFAPELIATSPFVRCYQTAEIVAGGMAGAPEVLSRPELVPGSDLAGMLQWTGRVAAECKEVAWVGHAPDVGNMTATLIGQPRGSVRFAKGATAAIRFPDMPAPDEGELRWLVTAKVLGC